MIARLVRGFPDWKLALCVLLAGVLGSLGQAPWSFLLLSLIGFGVAFYAFRAVTQVTHAAWLGWLFGLGYFALALSWIVEPFLVDAARHGWMAPFALLFLSGGLALLWAGAFVLAKWLGQGGLGLVVFWTASEMLRSVLFTGFPWALIGHIWIDTPILQVASVIGGHGLTVFALLIACLASAHATWRGPVLAGVIVAVFWGGSMVSLSGTEPEFSDKTVRLVQPNAEQHLKWDPRMTPVFFQRLLALSREPSEATPDLVVWPETALAQRLDRADQALEMMAEAASETPMVFGVNNLVEERYRNTLAVMGAGGEIETEYYKHHLVPFGEYLPLGELLARFGVFGLSERGSLGFGSGPGPMLIDLPGIGSALPLICYELIFPHNLRGIPRADLILQITNDAWFGEVSGPYQHLAQARLRAVEQGLPLLRAANTGISAAIDPKGRVTAQLDLGEAGYLDAALPKALPPTIYALAGDWPTRMVLVLLLAFLILLRRNGLSD